MQYTPYGQYGQYGQTEEELKKKRRKKRRRRIRRFVLLLILIAVLRKPAVSGKIGQLIGRMPVIGGVQEDSQLTAQQEDSRQSSQPDASDSDAESRPDRPEQPEQEKAAVSEELLAVMREAALEFEQEVVLDTDITDGKTSKELSEMIGATFSEMMRRNPELFWIKGYAAAIVTNSNTGEFQQSPEITFSFDDDFSESELKEMAQEMKQEAKRIIDTAPKTGSDYEKALFVHDYLVEHTFYDLEGYRKGSDRMIYTAYGALVNHAAVCNGYAAAYQYLLRKLGVNCMIATGTVKESARSDLAKNAGSDGGHAWNWVELDGKFYWVDVTWDDPLNEDGQDAGGPVRHEYCFVDDNKISETRMLDEDNADPPVCIDMTLNDQLMEADRKAAENP